MSTRGRQKRRRRIARVHAAVAACLVSAAGPAAAADLSARSVLSYEGTDQDQGSSRAFHQTHDVAFQRPFSEALSYRLSLRYQDDRGSNVATGQTQGANASRALRPLAEAQYHLGNLTLGGGYDLIYSDAHTESRLSSRRTIERARGSVVLKPLDLPALGLVAEQRSTKDLVSGTDQAQTDLGQSVQYDGVRLAVQQAARYQRFDDRGLGFARTLTEASGRVAYESTIPFLPGGALIVSNQATVNRTEEASVSGSVIAVPNPVTGGAGVYSKDEHPGTSPGVPMSALPALADGNIVASTGVSLGPDSTSFQNLGLDMGRFVAVDVLRIYVRTAAGNLVPSGGPVTFDVFTSADAVTWFPATAVAVLFNAPGSYYDVQFASVTARFFKAVSFGTNTTETLVTEVQPLASATFSPRERRETVTWLDTLSLAVSTTPLRSVTVRYAGLANLNDARMQGGVSLSQVDADQVGSVSWQAAEPLRLEARYQRRDLRVTAQPSQRTDVLTGVVDLTPRPELRHQLTVSRIDDNALSRVSHTNAASVVNTLALYRTWDLSLTLGVARQLWPVEYQSIDRWYLNAMSLAKLLPELTATFTATVQRSRTATPLLSTAGLILPVARDEQYALELIYHPNPQLNLGARLGYSAGGGTSGLIQRYRLYWDPFPGGAIQVGGTFDQEVDATSQSRLSRVSGFLRWNVNPHAAFDSTYNSVRIHDLENSRNDFLAITFTLKL